MRISKSVLDRNIAWYDLFVVGLRPISPITMPVPEFDTYMPVQPDTEIAEF